MRGPTHAAPARRAREVRFVKRRNERFTPQLPALSSRRVRFAKPDQRSSEAPFPTSPAQRLRFVKPRNDMDSIAVTRAHFPKVHRALQ